MKRTEKDLYDLPKDLLVKLLLMTSHEERNNHRMLKLLVEKQVKRMNCKDKGCSEYCFCFVKDDDGNETATFTFPHFKDVVSIKTFDEINPESKQGLETLSKIGSACLQCNEWYCHNHWKGQYEVQSDGSYEFNCGGGGG